MSAATILQVEIFRNYHSPVNLLENLIKPQTNSFRKGFLIFMIYKVHRLTEKKSSKKFAGKMHFFKGQKRGLSNKYVKNEVFLLVSIL